MLIVIAAMLAATLISVAFGEDSSPSPGVVIEWLNGDDGPTATPAPTLPSVITKPATPTPGSTPSRSAVTGFAYPVPGACLPSGDELMPGALREYRDGIHEGVDFYDSDNCVDMGLDTEILAAKAGTVIRADLAYQELTPGRLAEQQEIVDAGDASSDPELLDEFRGRQLWIDHGNGIVTRYCHLSDIAGGISVGTRVSQGDLVAYMGESGTPESITDPGAQVHLHFEIRIGAGYLGEGLDPATVRSLYQDAFTP